MRSPQTAEIKTYIKNLIAHIKEAKPKQQVMNKSQRTNFEKMKETQMFIADNIFQKVVEIESRE